MVFFNLQNTMHVSCMFIPSEIFRMFGMLLVPLVFSSNSSSSSNSSISITSGRGSSSNRRSNFGLSGQIPYLQHSLQHHGVLQLFNTLGGSTMQPRLRSGTPGKAERLEKVKQQKKLDLRSMRMQLGPWVY